MKRAVDWVFGVSVALGLISGGVALWWNHRQPQHQEQAHAVVSGMGQREVEYQLTGSATGADLTFTDQSGQVVQAAGKSVPLETKAGGAIRFRAAPGVRLYLSAQNATGSGSLTCAILVDGVVVSTSTSDGGYTIVTCEA